MKKESKEIKKQIVSDDCTEEENEKDEVKLVRSQLKNNTSVSLHQKQTISLLDFRLQAIAEQYVSALTEDESFVYRLLMLRCAKSINSTVSYAISDDDIPLGEIVEMEDDGGNFGVIIDGDCDDLNSTVKELCGNNYVPLGGPYQQMVGGKEVTVVNVATNLEILRRQAQHRTAAGKLGVDYTIYRQYMEALEVVERLSVDDIKILFKGLGFGARGVKRKSEDVQQRRALRRIEPMIVE